LRLLACASCRAVWKWLGLLEQRAVGVAERYADGQAGDEERLALADEAYYVWARVYGRSLHTVLGLLADRITVRGCFDLCRTVLAVRGERAREEIQARLHDELFGPSGRVEFDPSVLAWRGGVVVELAKYVDEGRRFDALPILADALEEAGCVAEEVLDHCRRRGQPHVRGCWVVDLVLGR